MYKNKYLKYKSKYFKLVGGVSQSEQQICICNGLSESKNVSTKVPIDYGIIANEIINFLHKKICAIISCESTGLTYYIVVPYSIILGTTVIYTSTILNFNTKPNIMEAIRNIMEAIRNSKVESIQNIQITYINIDDKSFEPYLEELEEGLKEELKENETKFKLETRNNILTFEKINKILKKLKTKLVSINLCSLTNITEIDEYFCYKYTALEELLLPNTIKTIKHSFCYECSNLKTLSLSNVLTHIGMLFCFGCIALDGFTLPNTLTHIDIYFCFICPALLKLNLESLSGTINISQAVLNQYDMELINIRDVMPHGVYENPNFKKFYDSVRFRV